LPAAINLHNSLLTHMLRLPKTFFDTNPAGRILNRFSRDIDIMDSTLPTGMIQFTGCIAVFLASMVVVSIATKCAPALPASCPELRASCAAPSTTSERPQPGQSAGAARAAAPQLLLHATCSRHSPPPAGGSRWR
jgi:ABC-type multidrug transport system fused ATPase/permease subunit